MNSIKKDIKYSLIKKHSTIIVGLSGGPDSVFLLYALHQQQKEKDLTIIAAHLDHEWRIDSPKDTSFCKNLSQQLGIPFETGKYSEFSESIKKSGSKEDAARQARRLFFESTQKKYNADAIALAHHKQDQQETFFIRLLRGTSLTGLTGIKEKNGLYIRPLLNISKQEILSYLNTNKIKYLTDPTNTSDSFLRNRIRNHLIPSLKICDARFESSFTKTQKRLQETEELLEELTQSSLNTICVENKFLHIKNFRRLHTALRKRVLLLWICRQKVPFVATETFIAEIERFLSHHAGGTHRIHKSWSIKKQKGIASIVVHN